MALAILRLINNFRVSENPHGLFKRVPSSVNKLFTSNGESNYSASTSVENHKPLDGIRVLDLSRILAGPVCTMILGDMGAEIIKIEKPGSGDDTRSWGPPFVGTETCYFLSVNRNKKSVAVDIKNPKGIEIIKQLSIQSDVLIENFLPGKLENMGLGYSDLKQIAPHLVYCSITGFGSDGPYRNRAGYDVIAASIGGLLSITGPEDGDPCKVGVAMTDISTGLFAHGAILAAILQRSKTGLGQKIDCNLLSTQVACLVNLGSNYLNAGLESKRRGTAHESIVPYQAFETADGYITIGAGNNNQFETLCKIINCEHLLQNMNYKNNMQRVKNRKALLSILSSKFSEKNTEEWLARLHNSGIPYGPINSLEKVFNDPQVIHNGMIQEVNHPSAGKIKLTGPPVKFNNRANQAFLPPPCLGEHTTEILRDILKYPDEKIEELKSLNIIQ